MKKTTIYGILSILFLISCQMSKEAQEEKFLSTIDSFYQAINSGNKTAHADLFADDIIFMPDAWVISQGADAKESVKKETGYLFRIKELNRLDYGISGDIAYTVNEYYYTWHQEADQPEWHKTKNVHVWRLQTDGSWKLHVDIWNSTPGE
ncbi:MAG: DUF4440 domain-containing protein [Candidatus Marinimicrobia bacterium]|nr:DUF4440 domain-containing protein [Candidatus Neomarinimicrobiota bacterium]